MRSNIRFNKTGTSKVGVYLRLKKRKVFKICPGCIHETPQRVPFMLDKTRQPLFPQLGINKKKTFFSVA